MLKQWWSKVIYSFFCIFIYLFICLVVQHGFVATGVRGGGLISPLQHQSSPAFERPVPPAHTFNPLQPVNNASSDR